MKVVKGEKYEEIGYVTVSRTICFFVVPEVIRRCDLKIDHEDWR